MQLAARALRCYAILATLVAAASLERACEDAFSSALPFCSVALSIDERVNDLVGRLNLTEKISQIVSNASGIPRLGIPAYQWWQEALHGVAESPGVEFRQPIPGATSFPQVILTAASFNTSLWNQIGKVIAVEARAMYNAGESGLTFWSPNINIFRDPRWGRGQETPGEDPLLTSKYAAYFVRGLQQGDYQEETPRLQDSDARLTVSSCCKHFTAYDMEKSGGTDAFHFDAKVRLQDLEDTFNPPFRSCVEDGKASGIMCSYNRVNGVPTCADHGFLTDTVRNTWGFQGYIVSDCDAVALLYEYINYTKTAEEAVADVLLAGMDLNCGTFLLRHTPAAIQQGRVTEALVDTAVSNVMRIRMRLGLFDGNAAETYGSPGPAEVCTPDHQKLSLEAAEQGIVLLKNDFNTLPLDRNSAPVVAVIGPHGNASAAMLGNYAGIPCKFTTLLEGLADRSSNLVFESGCADVACSDNALINSAVSAAKQADVVILVLGLDKDQEREGLDRTSLLLPGRQQELACVVSEAVKGPVILVVMSGGPVDVSFAKDNPKISSILWAGYPGEAGGKAIANVIFGDHNPAGRLAMTWYPQEFTRVDMLDMSMRPNATSGYPGRTYRFYTGDKVFEFGHGLSYTNFTYSIVSAPEHITVEASKIKSRPSVSEHPQHCSAEEVACHSLNFDVVVKVHNVGTRDGDNVLLLFYSPPAQEGHPKEQLLAFRRIHLKAGCVADVAFSRLNVCKDLSLADETGKRVLVAGDYRLRIGKEQRSMFLSVA